MVGMRTIAAIALLLATNACAPLVVQQGGRTVKPGQTYAGMSMSALNISSTDDETDGKGSSTYVAMVPNGWARIGLGSSLDAGVQFYGGGTRVDAKLAPIQSDAFALAVCAGIGGGQNQTKDATETSADTTLSRHWFGDVGVFGTAGIGASMDLNFGVRALVGETYSEDEFDGVKEKDSSQQTGAGGFVSMMFKRGTWAVTPELAVYQITTNETEDPDATSDVLVILPSVGFSVGF